MPRLKLIITLMTIVAIIIVGIAVYVFTHLSGIDLTQGIFLIAAAVVGLFLILSIIILIMKGLTVKR
jgi:hypothetical protein